MLVSGPNIVLDTKPMYLYNYWRVAEQIEHGLRYFMKDRSIALFGHNINVPHSKLLVRAWLNATAHTNRALVLIDNVDDLREDDLHTYMIHVNNNSWRPHDWSEIEGAKTLHPSVCEQS